MTAANPSTIRARVADTVPWAWVMVRQVWILIQTHRCCLLVPRWGEAVAFIISLLMLRIEWILRFKKKLLLFSASVVDHLFLVSWEIFQLLEITLLLPGNRCMALLQSCDRFILTQIHQWVYLQGRDELWVWFRKNLRISKNVLPWGVKKGQNNELPLWLQELLLFQSEPSLLPPTG